jgi:hypothetical protein
MKYLHFCMVLLLCGSPTAAWGQPYYYDDAGPSTVGESYAQGVAGVIQAQGQRNLSNSQAAINYQDAFSSGVDNNLKATNAYYQKKLIHDQYQQQKSYERGQRASASRARSRLQALTAEDFDRTTGKINWPEVLDQAQYDQYRKSLDASFQKRAQTGALTMQDHMEAKAKCKAWRTTLTGQRGEFADSILHDLVRFVLKIERELDDNLS